MRAILLRGIKISVIDVVTINDMQDAIDGKCETLRLRDEGVMVCDREALPKERPYNSLASLIAGTGIYGDALIVGAVGDNLCDVPDPFLALLNFPEDYFKQ